MPYWRSQFAEKHDLAPVDTDEAERGGFSDSETLDIALSSERGDQNGLDVSK